MKTLLRLLVRFVALLFIAAGGLLLAAARLEPGVLMLAAGVFVFAFAGKRPRPHC